MKNSITMTDNRTNESYDFDILNATRGPSVVDISTFYAKTGMFTYDNGFTSTASCKSEITFIDGAKGELRYRGIKIEELATNHTFLETCYLLLNSKLPNKPRPKSNLRPWIKSFSRVTWHASLSTTHQTLFINKTKKTLSA